MQIPEPQEITNFWLNDIGPKGWYDQDNKIDALIDERYRETRIMAADDKLDNWQSTATGTLALIILLDQFSRNLYRGHAESFAADAKARSLTHHAIDKGFDLEFPMPLRQFFFMPLCHSEELSDQAYLLQIAKEKGLDDVMIDFHIHHDIIEQFGRFPFRNAAFGRESSRHEQAFLDEGGYSNLRKKYLAQQSDGTTS